MPHALTLSNSLPQLRCSNHHHHHQYQHHHFQPAGPHTSKTQQGSHRSDSSHKKYKTQLPDITILHDYKQMQLSAANIWIQQTSIDIQNYEII